MAFLKYGVFGQTLISQIELHEMRYEDNIRELASLAIRNSINVIFIKQGVDVINNQKKDGKTKMTYEEEVIYLQNRLEQNNWLTAGEAKHLVHATLMDCLESVAREYNIPVIDYISILNQHPEYYASYVHLTEAGNSVLAEELYNAISPLISK